MVRIHLMRPQENQSRFTRYNYTMRHISTETGDQLDTILFPEVYRQAKTWISSTKPFLLTGIMEMDTERGELFLRVEKVIPVA
jgi:hypothetical protein